MPDRLALIIANGDFTDPKLARRRKPNALSPERLTSAHLMDPSEGDVVGDATP